MPTKDFGYGERTHWLLRNYADKTLWPWQENTLDLTKPCRQNTEREREHAGYSELRTTHSDYGDRTHRPLSYADIIQWLWREHCTPPTPNWVNNGPWRGTSISVTRLPWAPGPQIQVIGFQSQELLQIKVICTTCPHHMYLHPLSLHKLSAQGSCLYTDIERKLE